MVYGFKKAATEEEEEAAKRKEDGKATDAKPRDRSSPPAPSCPPEPSGSTQEELLMAAPPRGARLGTPWVWRGRQEKLAPPPTRDESTAPKGRYSAGRDVRWGWSSSGNFLAESGRTAGVCGLQNNPRGRGNGICGAGVPGGGGLVGIP